MYIRSNITSNLIFIGNYFSSGAMFKRDERWLHGAYFNYSVYEDKDNKYVRLGCVEPRLRGKIHVMLCETSIYPTISRLSSSFVNSVVRNSGKYLPL